MGLLNLISHATFTLLSKVATFGDGQPNVPTVEHLQALYQRQTQQVPRQSAT